MIRTTSAGALALFGVLLATPAASGAQDAPTRGEVEVSPPAYGVTVGFGSTVGGLGVGVEYYLSGGRISALGGVGYIPFDQAEDATLVAWSGALRANLGSLRHRALLEASYSLLAVESTTVGFVTATSSQHYGPGLSAGYRLTLDSGLHVDLTSGVGRSLDGDITAMIGTLGVGFTWRR